MVAKVNVEDKVFEIVFDQDELNWKDILLNLIRSENMDPWDLDITLLSKKFMQMIKDLRELDFRVSGKIVLAAAFLLRLKSDQLLNEDIASFDELLTNPPTEDFELFELAQADFGDDTVIKEQPQLIPKMPQPRKRKVSVYDLVKALEKALDTKHRRETRKLPEVEIKIPKKSRDISLVMGDVYKQIINIFKPGSVVEFNELLPSLDKEDVIYTFIPLLHLDMARKIDILQQQHFGDININLLDSSGLKDVKSVKN